LVDGTNDEISKRNLQAQTLRDKKMTMSIGWTVAGAEAVVANWKILMPENREAMSAGNVSKH
jgi:hypothetical protein